MSCNTRWQPKQNFTIKIKYRTMIFVPQDILRSCMWDEDETILIRGINTHNNSKRGSFSSKFIIKNRLLSSLIMYFSANDIALFYFLQLNVTIIMWILGRLQNYVFHYKKFVWNYKNLKKLIIQFGTLRLIMCTQQLSPQMMVQKKISFIIF